MTTDMWKAYPAAAEAAHCEHLTVNHSEGFKDPNTGAHTNNVEGIHGVLKRDARAQFGRLPYITSQGESYYIDLLVWRGNVNLKKLPVFPQFFMTLWFWTHRPLEDHDRIIPLFEENEDEDNDEWFDDDEIEDQDDYDENGFNDPTDLEWFLKSTEVDQSDIESDD